MQECKDVSWPQLAEYEETSGATDEYNCIAYAYGEEDRWAWPGGKPGTWWPEGVRGDESVQAFVELFATRDYEPCSDALLEAGYEKIAIYAVGDVATHAARQLTSGRWTSKLGDLEDISHPDLASLEGGIYGTVATYLRRPRRAPAQEAADNSDGVGAPATQA